MLYDDNLVVRYNERYFSWVAVAPVIMTLVAFKREMPEEALQLLSNDVTAGKFEDILTKQQVKSTKTWRNWWGRASTNVSEKGTFTTVSQAQVSHRCVCMIQEIHLVFSHHHHHNHHNHPVEL
jgi:hypothetical protein